MRTSNRLSRHITLTFLIFGATLTVALGLGLVAALKSVETDVLDDTLRAELAHFRWQVEAARSLGAFNSRTTVIFVTPLDESHSIPNHVRDLPLGFNEVSHGDRNYRVLVEERGNMRYTVQYEDTNIHQREHQFVRLVWLSSLVSLLLAFCIGWLLSRRVSAPIRRLTKQITSLKDTPELQLDTSHYYEDEIGLLAHQLAHYHKQLGELLAREREFAGNVSHELRTPVTNISLAAEILAARSDLSAKDRHRIQRIQRATGEMTELVDTFLVLAQVDDTSGQQHSTCELRPIVDDVIEQQRVWLADKSIEITVDEQNIVNVAAPTRVVSVLIANLVRNAFRYTQEGQIHISLLEDRICVSDTGVGIDSATQSKLFERHVRGKSGDADGAGLGLSIVRRICERYGWSVTVTSIEGQGSSFTVQFSPKHA